MSGDKIDGIKEKYNNIKLQKLLGSEDDMLIRKEKFIRMQQSEELGNKIWKLGKEKANLISEATKLEHKERQLLNVPFMDIRED